MRRLLDGGAYSGINIHGEALIRGQHLLETRHCLEEIRQLHNYIHNSSPYKTDGLANKFYFHFVNQTCSKNYYVCIT